MKSSQLLWTSLVAGGCALPVFAALAPAPGPKPAAPRPNAEAVAFFEKEVRPLLVERCYACHGPKIQQGGLRLDSAAALLKGGDGGPVITTTDPDKSPLLHAVRYDGKLKMPPAGKLPEREIAILTRWVQMGAPWGVSNSKSQMPSSGNSKFGIRSSKLPWAFLPVKPPAVPAVKGKAWVKSPLDAFILSPLEAKGLKPALPADRRTLLRRATFDLTGLPPTPAEIDAFLADRSPDAFAKVVDRLLASPHFGERWGRHWLDVVRYCDSFDARLLGGAGNEMDVIDAWRYRDWVVNAFNKDLPYNQFIIDQIAGDLIPAPEPDGLNRDGIIATGMLALGNWGGGDADKEKLLTDIADDQVDVVSRSFMGLTVSCARCHDHKFDPISTEDYYGMAGIFFSTHILANPGPKTNGPPMLRIPLVSKADMARRARAGELEKQLQAAGESHRTALAKSLVPQTARYLLAAWDYQTRPADQSGLSIDQFAEKRGLLPFALRQWLDRVMPGEHRLLTVSQRDIPNGPGVHVWRGEADCPNVLVNTAAEARPILSFVLPPRSVSVHPGPTAGVAVEWRSPVTGVVKITGRVADADPNGGDGIGWAIEQKTGAAALALASGDIPNGGAQPFTSGMGAERLTSVSVRAGETLRLLVLPKNGHTCDTTHVEFTLALADGTKTWSLARDLQDDPIGKGNPHPDSYQNPGVWRFSDMNGAGGPADAALAQWSRAAAEAAAGRADRAALEHAAQAYQATAQTVDSRHPFWVRSGPDERYLAEAARTELTRLAAELDTLKKTPLPPVEYANGAQEGGVPQSPQAGVHDVKVHIRGRYDRLGKLVPRRFPVVLAGTSQPPITEGSGRLPLARWIASKENPLTARVLVNRVWQHLFGEGIVRTPSNFGKLGEKPSHPELLDYLAARFAGISNGEFQMPNSGGRKSGIRNLEFGIRTLTPWSIKDLIRSMLLSSAYQQASVAAPVTAKADPDNRLFGRMNRRRLEAEAIRDSLLVASGRLDRTAGGPATRDFSSPRRTLYQMTVRSDRTGFGPLFDVADPTASIDRRTVSTVAPQALFMLNHPFALEQTAALAKRILGEGPAEPTARVQRAYGLLYGRPPTAAELRIGLQFVSRAAGAKPEAEQQAWEQYCQVLLCANEFIFVD